MATSDFSKVGSTGFKKGAGTVHIKVTALQNLDEVGMFTHDVNGFNDLSDALSVRCYEKLATMREDADDGVVRVNMRKMFHLGQAKKLASSFPAEEEHHRALFTGIAKAEVMMPSILIPILEGLGPVENKDEKFKMVGQAAIVWTHLGMALADGVEECLGVNQNTTLGNMLYVGRDVQSMRALREYCVGEINAWVATAPAYQVQIGDNEMSLVEIHPPRFVQGATNWRAFTLGCGGRTPWLERVLRVVEILEEPGALTAARVQALNAMGSWVVVLDWSRVNFSQRLEEYIRRVQNPLRTVLTALGISSLMKGANGHGESWQLGTVATGTMVFTPHPIAPGVVEKGWMTMGSGVGVQIGHEKWIYNGNRSRKEAIEVFLNGSVKG